MARVLVVDDDLAVLEVLTVFLQSRGHQVLCARDGAEAREVLDRDTEGGAAAVEVLITDLRMPRLDGLDLVKLVRARGRPLPVVIMSGTWTADERARAAALGASRLYAKPIELDQLARDVEEMGR